MKFCAVIPVGQCMEVNSTCEWTFAIVIDRPMLIGLVNYWA